MLGEKKAKKVMEVSYYIAKNERGKGYCHEAVELLKKYLKENTKTKEMEFLVRGKNNASRNFLEKSMKLKSDYMTKEFYHYKLVI